MGLLAHQGDVEDGIMGRIATLTYPGAGQGMHPMPVSKIAPWCYQRGFRVLEIEASYQHAVVAVRINLGPDSGPLASDPRYDTLVPGCGERQTNVSSFSLYYCLLAPLCDDGPPRCRLPCAASQIVDKGVAQFHE